MPSFMWTPAQAKPFLLVAVELHLRVDLTSRYKGMLSPIEDQDPPVRTHCGDDVWVLGLIAGFVHFLWMIDFLYNLKFDLIIGHFLARPAAIASYLFSILVVVDDVGRHGLR